jgi:hypothetical protein
MATRETIQLIHEALATGLQPAMDALPAPASADVTIVDTYLQPYLDDSLEATEFPAVVVTTGEPEPPNLLRQREPEPGTGEWGDLRVPVAVQYAGIGGDYASERAAAGAAMRAAYQVVRRAAGKTMGEVRLVGIVDPAIEWPAYDDTRVRATLRFIALARDEAI